MKHLAIAVVLTACTASVLAETNYCCDPAATASWERIKRKHRGERDIEALGTLRERLCREVDAGAISVSKSSRLSGRGSSKSGGITTAGKRSGVRELG